MKFTASIVLHTDNLPAFLSAVKTLAAREVLVGVPAEKTDRRLQPGETGEEPTNALIAYVQEHGSPTQNIPPRPFMDSGIQNAKSDIVTHLTAAGQAALGADAAGVDEELNAAGLVAQNSIQRKITDGPFKPLAPATLKARQRRDFKGTKPLIETGQLRQAITYVVRSKKDED